MYEFRGFLVGAVLLCFIHVLQQRPLDVNAMSSDNFTPPPAPCEGFLCYYEAGDNYLSSSVVWKLIIAVSIISAICFVIALIFCITNCRRKTRTEQAKDRHPVLKSIPPPPPIRNSPASEKVAPFAVPEEV